jgi:hypothetical protein
MSSRVDIPNRLIYTCNCGWIDLGHLNSIETPRNRNASAAYLWKDVSLERGLQIGGQADRHLIMYEQKMSRFGLSRGFAKFYSIKRGLSITAKRSVALSIFMDVSLGFESVQASLSTLTDSGFSEEDLVSNLIGFYVVVYESLDWRTLCKPVSKDASLKIWDVDGSVGSRKNKAFVPKFHECDECKSKHHVIRPQLPALFNSIQPATRGVDFYEPAPSDMPVPPHLLSTLFK